MFLKLIYKINFYIVCKINKAIDSLKKGIFPDLLATSGDYLRVWRSSSETETRLETLLNNVSELS